MPRVKTRFLNEKEVLERVAGDKKVGEAFEDLIRAIKFIGRDHVIGSHLLDVIAHRMDHYEQMEIETEEGLDGEVA